MGPVIVLQDCAHKLNSLMFEVFNILLKVIKILPGHIGNYGGIDMGRNYGKEIDMLQSTLSQLQSEISKQNKEVERLSKLVDSLVNDSGQGKGQGSSAGNNKCLRARELKKKADAEGWKGAIESYSAFSCNERGYFTETMCVQEADAFFIA